MSEDERTRENSRATGQGSVRHTLRVGVVHGDVIRCASHTLVLGHYEDDAIVDLEEAVDERLGGRLSQRYRLGVYPGPLGSADVIPGRDGGRDVLVIGLGLVGNLTLSGLGEAVTRGVLRYAAEARDGKPRAHPASRRPATVRGLGLSFVLIGGNSPGLSIDDSVLGIVRGVLAANRALRPTPADVAVTGSSSPAVSIDEIEFVELYEGRAEVAARAVRDLLTRLALQIEDDERVAPVARVRNGHGGEAIAPAQPGRSHWWRRILIRDLGTQGVHFLTLTDSARAEGQKIMPNRSNVDRYVEALRGDLHSDQAAAATLFHLILPNPLKVRLSAERDLILVFERGDGVEWRNASEGHEPLPPTDYPWELIGERRGGACEPLALRVGLVRQLRVDGVRPAPPPRGRHVLVVGAPKTAPEDRLKLLRGAITEGRAVAKQLRSAHFDVHELIRPTGREVLDRLFQREWLVVHVTGHGAYRAGDRARSGIYLDDGLRLTTAEIEQLPVVPSLVFLNTCYVGAIDPVAHASLAASLSEQLIRCGVRAVVAAGWSVDDAAAVTFAKAFYVAMLAGTPFGAALLSARRKTHSEHPRVNTWGAYQAYGDPGFVLQPTRVPQSDRSDDPVSRHELRQRLVAFAGTPWGEASAAGKRLRALLGGMGADWLADPVVRELEGAAWWALGERARAIAAYRHAAQAGSGTVSLRALLQLSNLEVRRVLHGEGQDGAKDLHDALQRIERIIALQESAEAWAHKASALKRIAASPLLHKLMPDTSARQMLVKAAEAYGRSAALARSAEGVDRIAGGPAYPLLNQLVLDVLLGRVDDVAARIALIERARTPGSPADTLRERSLPANLALVRWLAKGAPEDEIAGVVEGFENTRGDATEGEFLSTPEQVDWMVRARRALLGVSGDGRDHAKTSVGSQDALKRLEVGLRALSTCSRARPGAARRRRRV